MQEEPGSMKLLLKEQNGWLIFITLLISFHGVVNGHAVETNSVHQLTVTAGQKGVIPILHEWSTSIRTMPYHTIGFEDIDMPFYRTGRIYPNGFKVHDQQDRFTMNYEYNAQFISANLTIDPVKVEDEGTYVSTIIFINPSTDRRSSSFKINVSVHVPPGSASCFIKTTANNELFFAVCSTTVGSNNAAITCFHDEYEVPFEDINSDVSEVIIRKFFVTLTYPISCCSYDEEDAVTVETCDDFRWPPVTHRHISTAMSTLPVDGGLLSNNDDSSTVSPPKGSANRILGAFLPMLINALVAFIALDI